MFSISCHGSNRSRPNAARRALRSRTAVLALLLLLFTTLPAFAQDKTITVIVFRHADKEIAVEGDDSDPDISIDGQKRAIRLAKILRKHKVSRIFSTNYARTIQTVTPFLRAQTVPVEFYEPGAPNDLIAQILQPDGRRRVAVAAHNSTAFALVNLLLKEQKYKMPEDDDYGNIWILRIRNGRIRERRLVY